MGIAYFSGVFASLEPVPGQDWSLAFPCLCAVGGADVSTDHPLLWAREKKMDSSVAMDSPNTQHLCPEPFQPHQKHITDLSLLAPFTSIAGALLCELCFTYHSTHGVCR